MTDAVSPVRVEVHHLGFVGAVEHTAEEELLTD